jgi:hypothetical protein
MPLNLTDQANGDTNYVATINDNWHKIKLGFDVLETLAQAVGGGGGIDIDRLLRTLFGEATTRIGEASLVASAVAGGVQLTSGTAWIPSAKRLAYLAATATVSLVGQPAGTYYATVDNSGSAVTTTIAADALATVVWNGTAATSVIGVTRIGWADYDWQLAQSSTNLGSTYTNLDARLEASEGGGAVVAGSSGTAVATEVIAAGQIVNIYNNGLGARARLADATAATQREASGFCTVGAGIGGTITWAWGGTVGSLSGLTPGHKYMLSKTAGGVTNDITAYVAGDLSQRIGTALTATTIAFALGDPIAL